MWLLLKAVRLLSLVVVRDGCEGMFSSPHLSNILDQVRNCESSSLASVFRG